MNLEDTLHPTLPKPCFDDASILAFLRKHAHRLEHELPRKVTLTSPAVFTLYEEHPTHWMIFGWYDPTVYGSDSGWLVNSWPKAFFTLDAITTAFKTSVIRHHAGGDSTRPFERL